MFRICWRNEAATPIGGGFESCHHPHKKVKLSSSQELGEVEVEEQEEDVDDDVEEDSCHHPHKLSKKVKLSSSQELGGGARKLGKKVEQL